MGKAGIQPYINLIGQKFGRLLVISKDDIRKTSNRAHYWNCLCDCGDEKSIRGDHLGVIKSCGCLQKDNGYGKIKKLQVIGKHLYFIKCGDYLKVGRTSDYKKRIRMIKVNNPYPIELISYRENEGDKEHYYHELFKFAHHQGEWFHWDLVKDLIDVGHKS